MLVSDNCRGAAAAEFKRWTAMPADSVVDEIRRAVDTLRSRGEDISATLLDSHRGEAIYKTALRTFVAGADRRWWWEDFKLPYASRYFESGDGWRSLAAIVPEADESAWFIAEDGSLPFYPVFELTPAAASRIIGECYGFEYYIAAKDFSWLICENHHNTVFAVGDAVARNLARAAI